MTLLVAPLVVVLAAAQAPFELNTKLSIAFGKVYWVTATVAALDKAPVWKDDAANPPLSARKAIKLADEARGRRFKDPDEWEWRRALVELCDAGKGRWYWSVRYQAYYKGIVYFLRLPEIYLLVLMDGTVVEPTELK